MLAALWLSACGKETIDLDVAQSTARTDSGLADAAQDGARPSDASADARFGPPACAANSDCAFFGGGVCSAAGRCECANSDQCVNSPSQRQCDVTTSTCVECLNDADCNLAGSGLVCDVAVHRCTAACDVQSDCSGFISRLTGRDICNPDPARSVCVECVTDADCAGRPFRGNDSTCRNGACVICNGCRGR